MEECWEENGLHGDRDGDESKLGKGRDKAPGQRTDQADEGDLSDR